MFANKLHVTEHKHSHSLDVKLIARAQVVEKIFESIYVITIDQFSDEMALPAEKAFLNALQQIVSLMS